MLSQYFCCCGKSKCCEGDSDDIIKEKIYINEKKEELKKEN